MVLSGAWGKLIHEKNQKQKISWHCPFNNIYKDLKNRVLRAAAHTKQVSISPILCNSLWWSQKTADCLGFGDKMYGGVGPIE